MAHPDLDNLLNFCLRFAEMMLYDGDGFHPFAATVNSRGDIGPANVNPEEDHPDPDLLIERYRQVLRALAASTDIQGSAVCYDSRISETGEERDKKAAIAVDLEHRNGECGKALLPYRKVPGHGYRYDSLIVIAGEPTIFLQMDSLQRRPDQPE